MSSLFEMLSQHLGGDNLGKLSTQIGADEKSTAGALSAALPLLVNALSRNASTTDGADALSNALSRDHDGSILNSLPDFIDKPDMNTGDGILRHVLGTQRSMVESGLSKSSGLNAGSVGKLLGMLAPVVMGALGRMKQERSMDARSLSGYLRNEQEEMERSEPQAMGFVGNLLDADRDGDVDAGDLVKHGFSLFRKFFRS